MCTLLLWKRVDERYPLIVAANRDEFLDRPSTGPQPLALDPLVVGGRDEVAGGTWFAVNAAGLIVALTNRRGAGSHDPTRRSRGVLVTRIASASSFDDALAQARRVDPRTYNPFVLLLGDVRDAAVVHCGEDGIRIDRITDGPHAITNWDLDAPAPPKAAHAFGAARSAAVGLHDDPQTDAARLHALLADHGEANKSETALCVHRPAENYGTRSSTIALLGREASETRLFHAEGPPCTATLADFSALLRHDTRGRASKDPLS